MSKLFEIGKHGNIVCAEELKSYKTAKVHIDALQSKKSMVQNWKLDIFIDQDTFALCVMKISRSAAYKKGVWEWGINSLKIRCKGHQNLEQVGSSLLASFPTPEAAFESIEYIACYLQHRYNLNLEIIREIRHEAY